MTSYAERTGSSWHGSDLRAERPIFATAMYHRLRSKNPRLINQPAVCSSPIYRENPRRGRNRRDGFRSDLWKLSALHNSAEEQFSPLRRGWKQRRFVLCGRWQAEGGPSKAAPDRERDAVLARQQADQMGHSQVPSPPGPGEPQLSIHEAEPHMGSRGPAPRPSLSLFSGNRHRGHGGVLVLPAFQSMRSSRNPWR